MTVALAGTQLMTGAVVVMGSRLLQLCSGRFAQRVGEVEAGCPPPELFDSELTIGVFAVAVPSHRHESVLLSMLSQGKLLADGDRPVPLGVSTGRIPFDHTAFGTVQEAIVIGALETDADPLGQQERQHGRYEYGDPQEVRHGVQGNVELGGDHVVTAAEPEHSEPGHGRHTEPGSGRVIAWTVQQVMLGLVAGHPRLVERVDCHAAEDQRHGQGQGQEHIHDQVVDPICHSQPGPGMIRMAPSANPMYQSGWDPAVTCAGLYGPKTQTGLICISAPIKVTTPKTMKKKPPALAA